MDKKVAVLSGVLAAVAMPSAFADAGDSHLYGSVGYQYNKTADVKLHGAEVMVGNRFSIDDNQSVRLEVKGMQTQKKHGVKMQTVAAKTAYEYAIPVSDNVFVIPTGAVGYTETKIKAPMGLNTKLKSGFGEVGVRAQTNVGDVVVMPELSYMKPFKGKLEAAGIKEKVDMKHMDTIRTGVLASKEVSDGAFAVTGGLHHEVAVKKLHGNRAHRVTVSVGADF